MHDLDGVAVAPALLGALMDGALAAIIHAHHDFIAVVGVHITFDLIAGYRAADGASHRSELTAMTAADMIAQQAAQNGAAGRAHAAALGARADFADRLDHAAVMAHLGHLRGRCGTTLRGIALLLHSLPLLPWLRRHGRRSQ